MIVWKYQQPFVFVASTKEDIDLMSKARVYLADRTIGNADLLEVLLGPTWVGARVFRTVARTVDARIVATWVYAGSDYRDVIAIPCEVVVELLGGMFKPTATGGVNKVIHRVRRILTRTGVEEVEKRNEVIEYVQVVLGFLQRIYEIAVVEGPHIVGATARVWMRATIDSGLFSSILHTRDEQEIADRIKGFVAVLGESLNISSRLLEKKLL